LGQQFVRRLLPIGCGWQLPHRGGSERAAGYPLAGLEK
jgi:hypothetical protein